MKGKLVDLKDTLDGFKGILDGKYDKINENAFYLTGTIKEVQEQAIQLEEQYGKQQDKKGEKRKVTVFDFTLDDVNTEKLKKTTSALYDRALKKLNASDSKHKDAKGKKIQAAKDTYLGKFNAAATKVQGNFKKAAEDAAAKRVAKVKAGEEAERVAIAAKKKK